MNIFIAAALAASGAAEPAGIDPAVAQESRAIAARLEALRPKIVQTPEARVAQWNDWYNGWSDWRNWRNW